MRIRFVNADDNRLIARADSGFRQTDSSLIPNDDL
jgi:hypothetical protein